MKTKSLYKFYSTFLLLPLFLLASTSSVFAIGNSDYTGSNAEERRVQAQAHLSEAKLKACQTRENAIHKRSGNLINMATTMQEKFAAIEERVQEYYNEKIVLSNNTVSNYDSLVADIQTEKAAVQAALTQAQTNADSFICTSDNPKEQVMQFKDDMRSVKSALQDYRTAIKNLIVGVHSVTGETEREDPTETQGVSQ